MIFKICNILKDHTYLEILNLFVLIKKDQVTIQTSNLKWEPSFVTVNYLVGNFIENVDVPIFEQVIS